MKHNCDRRAFLAPPVSFIWEPFDLHHRPGICSARFEMDVVVLIRHLAAFAGSLKTAGWAFPFEYRLQQPLLMEQHLANDRNEIEAQVRDRGDIIDQSILLWNVTHHVILKYKTE